MEKTPDLKEKRAPQQSSAAEELVLVNKLKEAFTKLKVQKEQMEEKLEKGEEELKQLREENKKLREQLVDPISTPPRHKAPSPPPLAPQPLSSSSPSNLTEKEEKVSGPMGIPPPPDDFLERDMVIKSPRDRDGVDEDGGKDGKNEKLIKSTPKIKKKKREKKDKKKHKDKDKDKDKQKEVKEGEKDIISTKSKKKPAKRESGKRPDERGMREQESPRARDSIGKIKAFATRLRMGRRSHSLKHRKTSPDGEIVKAAVDVIASGNDITDKETEDNDDEFYNSRHAKRKKHRSWDSADSLESSELSSSLDRRRSGPSSPSRKTVSPKMKKNIKSSTDLRNKKLEKENKKVEKENKKVEKETKKMEKETKKVEKENKKVEKENKKVEKEKKSKKKESKENKEIKETKDSKTEKEIKSPKTPEKGNNEPQIPHSAPHSPHGSSRDLPPGAIKLSTKTNSTKLKRRSKSLPSVPSHATNVEVPGDIETRSHTEFEDCRSREKETEIPSPRDQQVIFPIFGRPLKEIIPAEEQIPQILKLSVEYLKKRGLDTEGLFRVPASTEAVGYLKNHFNQGNVPVFVDNDTNDIAGLLKAFLRELPEPLIPKIQNDKIGQLVARHHSSGSDEQEGELLKALRGVIDGLPDPNYSVFKYLIEFLHCVVDHSDTNLMNVDNIIRCFVPSMRCSPACFYFPIKHYHFFFEENSRPPRRIPPRNILLQGGGPRNKMTNMANMSFEVGWFGSDGKPSSQFLELLKEEEKKFNALKADQK